MKTPSHSPQKQLKCLQRNQANDFINRHHCKQVNGNRERIFTIRALAYSDANTVMYLRLM